MTSRLAALVFSRTSDPRAACNIQCRRDFRTGYALVDRGVSSTSLIESGQATGATLPSKGR